MWEHVQPSRALPCVPFDFAAAGALAAGHLSELGHRKFGALALDMVEGTLPTQEMYAVRGPELVVRESTGPAPSRRRS